MDAHNPPNIILILNDDMGYSDLQCYGGEIDTPNLNNLAEKGLRFTQFYNTARCCPSRASLLTGLHPHQAGIGDMVNNLGYAGYIGSLNKSCVTIAEVLHPHGYKTYLSGKWHVTNNKWTENDSWPMYRGFDHCYCFLGGASSYYWPCTMVRDNTDISEEVRNDPNYYITDAISDNAAEFIRSHKKNHADTPFFLYTAYTAPHWPLHAREEDIARFRGRFADGWDRLREQRMQRMIATGIIDPKWELTDRDPNQPPWTEVDQKEWEQRRMEVYAAQIFAMDRGIGRIVQALQETGQLENTIIMFLADNGGCAEGVSAAGKIGKVKGGSARAETKDGRPVRFGNTPEIIPGPEDTFTSYGQAWANLSNTPFRMYKKWTHEGGISTPFIVHWPDGIKSAGELRHQYAQLMDVMATICDVTKIPYPTEYNGNQILPLEGKSLMQYFSKPDPRTGMMFFEHEGNAAVRDGPWKLVRDFPFPWELYNIEEDRSEMHNLIEKEPEQAQRMKEAYEKWATRVGVVSIERIFVRHLKFHFGKLGEWLVRRTAKRTMGHRRWQQRIREKMHLNPN
jgi:arylsulfatase